MRLTDSAYILITPAIHSASIATKLVQSLGGATVIGPVLLGLSKPVQIAPLSASVSKILNMAMMAAYEAPVKAGRRSRGLDSWYYWSQLTSFGGRSMAKTKNNRTPESEMRIGALQVARSKRGGFATTAEVKAEIHKYVNLTPEDHQPSPTRQGEELYHQIVGNVVCHKGSSYSLFKREYAIRQDNGLTITQAGLDRLTALGL